MLSLHTNIYIQIFVNLYSYTRPEELAIYCKINLNFRINKKLYTWDEHKNKRRNITLLYTQSNLRYEIYYYEKS